MSLPRESHGQQAWMERNVRAVLDHCEEVADNLCNLSISIDADLEDSGMDIQDAEVLIAQKHEFALKLIACSERADRAAKILWKLRSRATRLCLTH